MPPCGGTPVVQSYQIGLYIVGASQPFQTVSLGKPTPDGTGTITVDMTAAFLGWPIVGTNYTADVAAVGPGGVARSALSNTFSFTGGGSCSFTVSPTSHSPPATGGPYTTTVATTSGCAWTGASNAAWITVTSGGSGTGNGTVAYTVAANTSTSPRIGTLTIAGQTVTVTQGAAPVVLRFLKLTDRRRGWRTYTTAVTTTSGCAWTGASNNTAWITVTGGSSGTGNGTVAYTVAANTSTSPRIGTLTIAAQTVTVTQAGACSFTLAPTSQSVAAAGGAATATVTAGSGCAWTGVSNSTSWITVTGGSSGQATARSRTTSRREPQRARAPGR